MTGLEPDALPPTPASTVVLVRDQAGVIETLMLRRNSAGSFAGMWVFPGGKVDPGDADPADGHDGADEELAAARRAGVRETFEEAGLVLDPDSLVALSHWLPPTSAPRKFSTWFFVASVDEAVVEVDGQEIHEHRWLPAKEAMRQRDAGEIELAPPTWITLETLARYDTVTELLAAASEQPPQRYHTRLFGRPTGAVLLWRGDAGYDRSDPETPGNRHRLTLADGAWRYERSD